MSPADTVVYGFLTPHDIGTICTGRDCKQCPPSGSFLSYGVDGEVMEDQPMLILAPATEEQWREFGIRMGADPANLTSSAPFGLHHWFYFVSTD